MALVNSGTTQPFSVKLKWDKDLRGKELDDSMFGGIQVHKSLVHLHRKIEQQYTDLPWPPTIKRATIMTEAPGGRGDVAAAGKVIKIIQDICPSLEFDWAVVTLRNVTPKLFLNCADPSKVDITMKGKDSNLLIVGPAKCGLTKDYIQGKVVRAKIDGPMFCFLEAGTEASNPRIYFACMNARKQSSAEEINEILLKIHKRLFSTECRSEDGICMGLLPGSGIFFDQSRLDTPLSHRYCCPAPLLKIEDDSLREDILRALDITNKDAEPNYDLHSFNSGYAHRADSWGKFIDFVAIHEKKKHLTVVLNQHGVFDKHDTNSFCKTVFTPERLKLLEQLGYGTIKVKGEEEEAVIVQESTEKTQRHLTVVVRLSFKPQDMKHLQLASERLLATGMNTPAEAWAARCKLYIYEDVGNSGVTDKFLKQQIKVAKTINPKLGRLLEIAGTYKSLSPEEMAEATQILHDPQLSTATLKFCNHTTSNYRFQDALVGSLKRVMWHHYIPKLAEIEADAMDDDFKAGLLKYLGSFDTEKQVITIKNLPILAQRVQTEVKEFMQNQ